ncbi:ORF1 [Anemone nepovirus A]|uniref:RNA1 polyprotein n=1 Tax=Anemone nepovirus A TaxID=2593930 RepID=A0A7G3W8P1_9SECO|nr:ORF1 [Anemone nepovirus A]QED42866.1 ORF1 [Anemone nepovirus A]
MAIPGHTTPPLFPTCKPSLKAFSFRALESSCTSHQEVYDRARRIIFEYSPAGPKLFNHLNFSDGWKSVPGMMESYKLCVRFAMVLEVFNCCSIVSDTYSSLMNGENCLDVYSRAMSASADILDCLTSSGTAQGFGDFLSAGSRIATKFAKQATKVGVDVAFGAAEVTADCASKVTRSVCDTVVYGAFIPMVKILRKEFDETIGKFIPKILDATAQIENLWRKSLEWATNMQAKLDVSLRVLKGSAFVGAGLLLVSGIIYFVEQLLQGLGLMTGTGTLLSLFIGGVLIAYNGGLSGIFDAQATRVRGILCEVAMRLYAKPKSMGGQTVQGVGDIFGVPLNILNCIGDGLVHHSLDTLQLMGKFGSAMDNVRKGLMCMRTFVSWLMEHLAIALDYITGKKTAFFKELATLIHVDVEKWVKDSQEFLLSAEIMADGDRVILDTCLHLLSKGQKVQSMMAATKSGTSFNYSRIVADLVKRLNDVYKRFKIAGRKVLYRQAPFWIYLYGGARCGKSLFAQRFLNAATEYMGTTVDNVYYKNARDDFWSQYRQEAIVCIDDLSSVETTPSIESEFIQLITTMRYGLNMAGVEEKGAQFNSQMCITTSNFFTAPTTAKIHDMNAYNDRRHAVVEVQRVPGTTYDAKRPDLSTQARYVDSRDQTPRSDWMMLPELTADLLTKFQAHKVQQADEQAYLKSTMRSTHDVFDILKEHIEKDIFWLSQPDTYLPPTEKCKYKGNRLLAVDGKIYYFDYLNFDYQMVDLVPGIDAAHIEQCSLAKYGETRLLLEQWGTNGVVTQFIEQLLEGPSYVASAETLTADSLESHKEFFSTLPLVHRATLRLVQKKIDLAKEDLKQFGSLKGKFDLAPYFLESYEWVYNNGGKLLLVLAAVILILFFGSACIGLLKTIFVGGASASATVGAMTRMSLQSTIPSSSDMNVHMVRSMKTVFRPSSLQSSSAHRDVFNASHAVHLLVRIDLPNGNIISACRFKARSLALTYHQAKMILPGTRVGINYVTNNGAFMPRIEHVWQTTNQFGVPNLRQFDSTEVCVYTHPELSALPCAPGSFFVKDIEKFTGDIVVKGAVIKLGRESAFTESLRANEPFLHHWEAVVSVRTSEFQIDNYEYGGDYCKKLPNSLVGEYINEVEDCGGILVAKVADSYRVVGMHVSGSSYTVEGPDGREVRKYVSTAALFPDFDSFESVQSRIRSLELEDDGNPTRGVHKVGHIKDPAESARCGGKTKLELVPEAFLIPSPVPVKIPSVLSGSDPRLPDHLKGTDPLAHAMDKFHNPMRELDDSVVGDVIDDIYDTFYDCSPNLSLMDDEEVINGSPFGYQVEAIVQNTSEGWPHVNDRLPGEKGKARFLEEYAVRAGKPLYRLIPGTSVHKAYVALEQQIAHEVPMLIGMEVPKDERLKREKVLEKVGTRTFTVLPMEYNLLLRKYVGKFASFIQTNRHRLACAVGTNPYSREWTDMFRRLAHVSNEAINCDYSKFDGLLNYQIYRHIVALINRTYGDNHQFKRHNLLMAMFGRWSICGQRVFEVRAGMPSGCALTVIINSLFNEILIRYVYRIVVPPRERSRFNSNVCLIVYGDDNLVAIDRKLTTGIRILEDGQEVTRFAFNGEVIKSTLANFGITITDGSDKNCPVLVSKPLTSLDFLKRGFSLQPSGRVLAPLDLQSIFSSLHYINFQGDMLHSLFLNVNVALHELWLHQDVERYNFVRNFFVSKCGGQFLKLPSWRVAGLFHDDQYANTNSFSLVKLYTQDIPDNTLFFENHAPKQVLSVVERRIYVAGAGWNNPDPDTYLVVSLNARKGNEDCIHWPADFGEGAGQMATRTSIKAYGKKSANTVRMKQFWQDGGSIVFRCEAPFISGWAAAITFANALGFQVELMEQSYILQGGRHSQFLHHYFANEQCSLLQLTKQPYTRVGAATVLA